MNECCYKIQSYPKRNDTFDCVSSTSETKHKEQVKDNTQLPASATSVRVCLLIDDFWWLRLQLLKMSILGFVVGAAAAAAAAAVAVVRKTQFFCFDGGRTHNRTKAKKNQQTHTHTTD